MGIYDVELPFYQPLVSTHVQNIYTFYSSRNFKVNPVSQLYISLIPLVLFLSETCCSVRTQVIGITVFILIDLKEQTSRVGMISNPSIWFQRLWSKKTDAVVFKSVLKISFKLFSFLFERHDKKYIQRLRKKKYSIHYFTPQTHTMAGIQKLHSGFPLGGKHPSVSTIMYCLEGHEVQRAGSGVEMGLQPHYHANKRLENSNKWVTPVSQFLPLLWNTLQP